MSASLQERRRQHMAAEITRTAMELFARRGFAEVTVDEIAAAVGMSARTFFRYFTSKEEVVVQYERRLIGRLVDALLAQPEEEPAAAALRQAYLATSHVAPADREEVRMVSRFVLTSRPLAVRVHGERSVGQPAVVAEVARRLGRDPVADPLPETVAVAMGAVASTAFWRWVASGSGGDPSEAIAAALDVLEAGLAALTTPGRVAGAQA